MASPKKNSSSAPATRSASRSKTLSNGARKPKTAASLVLAKKPSKFGNKACEVGGQKYRSKREANRHQALMLLAHAGLVENLRREVRFELAPAVKLDGKTKPALRYFADFVYFDKRLGREVVEDCKGHRTDVYRIKRHLMKSVHGVDILET